MCFALAFSARAAGNASNELPKRKCASGGVRLNGVVADSAHTKIIKVIF